jgi:hypothetical protein
MRGMKKRMERRKKRIIKTKEILKSGKKEKKGKGKKKERPPVNPEKVERRKKKTE